MDYWTSQLLTSHGCIGAFRCRIRKATDPACLDCEGVIDDAEHVMFACPEYDVQRSVSVCGTRWADWSG